MHAPAISIDFTLFIQAGLFFASWMVLHFLVFKPYLALIEARHAKTTGLMEEAAKAKLRATQLETDYETFMKAERKKISEWTDGERRKVGDEEREIVGKARAEVTGELEALRKQVNADLEKARKDLLPQVGEYSSHIVSKLVGYNVKVPPSVLDGKKKTDAESAVTG